MPWAFEVPFPGSLTSTFLWKEDGPAGALVELEMLERDLPVFDQVLDRIHRR